MSPTQKQREKHDEFQQIRPLAEQGLMKGRHVQQTPQREWVKGKGSKKKKEPKPKTEQELINDVLTISDAEYEEHFKDKIDQCTTDEEKIKAIFSIIKAKTQKEEKAGDLGIEYVYSSKEGREPKTPKAVLTPNKKGDYEGKLTADCDELTRLFVAVAEKAGIDPSQIEIISMKQNAPGADTDMHMAVLVTITEKPKEGGKPETTILLVDPVQMKTPVIVPDSSLDTIAETYVKKSKPEAKVKGIFKLWKLNTPKEMAADYYTSKALHYGFQGSQSTEGIEDKKKHYQTMFENIKNAHKLDPNSPDLKTQVGNFINNYSIWVVGLEYGKKDGLKKAAKGAALVIEAYEIYSSIQYVEPDEVNITDYEKKQIKKQQQKDPETVAGHVSSAHDIIGLFHSQNGSYADAILEFDKAIKLSPKTANAYLHKATAQEELADIEKKKSSKAKKSADKIKSKEKQLAYLKAQKKTLEAGLPYAAFNIKTKFNENLETVKEDIEKVEDELEKLKNP